MLAMEEHKDLLLIGVKFEKLKMYDNAKRIYSRYIKLVGEMDRRNVIDYFYGYGSSETLEIANYEEAINKALLVEKLKKTYVLLQNFPLNWNHHGDALDEHNKVLLDFLHWAYNDSVISNDDISILNPMIDLLEKSKHFNISYNGSETLFDVVGLVVDKVLSVDIYRKGLI